MKSYPFSAARVFGSPLLIHPMKGKVIAEALADRMGASATVLIGSTQAQAFAMEDDFSAEGDYTGYDIVDGVAVIPIEGTLVHKASGLRPYSGMLGYNAIRTNLMQALADDKAKAIILLCNSPGGEVAGCFDLVDEIFNCRGIKPITAICDDMAYSACYAIASAADTIIVPRTGGVGSIGVITMHADYSKALKGAGIDVTIIQHGDRKAAGNEFNPLSEQDKSEFQANIDTLGELFIETVARNLGMQASKIRAMQARSYMGSACVDAGLAHAIMAPDQAFRVLVGELG